MRNEQKKSHAVGMCNICGVYGNLTEDHVPPKGSIAPRRVGMKRLPKFVNSEYQHIKDRISQNGVKFKTLCHGCNNHLLGKGYDPALNFFSRRVAEIIRNSKKPDFPSVVTVSVRPQRIARSIIGHLLAAEPRENMSSMPESGPKRELMRTYLLNSLLDMPDELNLYFWPFRADYQVILNGVAILRGDYIIKCDFLKYFPVAFLLTYQAPEPIKKIFSDRELLVRGTGLNEENLVSVRTRETSDIRSDWPEIPWDDEIMAIADHKCIVATPL